MTHTTSLSRATWSTEWAQAPSCGPTTWWIYWFPLVKVSLGAWTEHYHRSPGVWPGWGDTLGPDGNPGPWDSSHIWSGWTWEGENSLPVPHLPDEEPEAREGRKDGLSARAMEEKWGDLALTPGSSMYLLAQSNQGKPLTTNFLSVLMCKGTGLYLVISNACCFKNTQCCQVWNAVDSS